MAEPKVLLLALSLLGFLPGDPEDCIRCHGEKGPPGVPRIDVDAFRAGPHARNGCVSCHEDAEEGEDPAHAAPDVDLAPVACSECHDDVQEIYEASSHGRARAEGANGEDAATCVDCHGMHDIRKVSDPESRVYPFHLPETCGRCHGDTTLVQRHEHIQVPEAYQQYLRSVHGQGLTQAGLLVSATCKDCHGGHDIQPSDDPRSRIHPARVIDTCGGCHVGVKEEFLSSVHGQKREGTPVCTTCHMSHEIRRPGGKRFRLALVAECGTCHADLMESYRETYHGKATEHGMGSIAKCSDCHGHHDIRGADDPLSRVHPDNKLETCRQCHPGAPAGFAGFWAHPDHTDGENYPLLHGIYLAMAGLLAVVFSFFGLHTALWAIRGVVDRVRRKDHPEPTGLRIQRFERFHRIMHIFVIITFIGLAMTGAPLKYAEEGWAKALLLVLGGVETAGWLHRVCAVIMFGYFILHLHFVSRRVLGIWEEGVHGLLAGPTTLVPGIADVKDAFAQFRWFLGMGPKPTWDRWTYWEKFDYWAVFWGVMIIGSSGLVMWLPEFFCSFLPGWVVNVALVVHSEEALLAIGFIFIVHFFNNHIRVEKFPLDPVIFTGSVPEEEFKEERGREYERLKAEGGLEALRVEPPDPSTLVWARIFGITAWVLALGLMILIIYSYVSR